MKFWLYDLIDELNRQISQFSSIAQKIRTSEEKLHFESIIYDLTKYKLELQKKYNLNPSYFNILYIPYHLGKGVDKIIKTL